MITCLITRQNSPSGTMAHCKITGLLAVIFLSLSITMVIAQDEGQPCKSTIYCYGNILDRVQQLNVFPNDSKWFVDLPLRVKPEEAQVAFDALGLVEDITKAQATAFVTANFWDSPAAELVPNKPADWKPVSEGGLTIHSKIADTQYRDLADEIHKKWESLGRTVAADVRDNPAQHSLIYVPNPFIIPGGRFRETYYWDSFWTIQGLLVSGMKETARGMIYNFKHLIDTIGHIPNGNRVYYERRSQPPFLALMVDAYIHHSSVSSEAGKQMVTDLLPALVKEYAFWMTQRATDVTYKGQIYKLNLFKGGMSSPRPESYREDMHETANMEETNKRLFHEGIAAGAESGWDFSSRWVDNAITGLSTIRTETIVPVDLNALICAQLRIIGEFHQLLGHQAESATYRNLAKIRADAIHAVFWNADKVMWRDFDLKTSAQREDFYISHVVPIFAKCVGTVDITSTDFLNKVLNSADIKKLTSYPGGFPQSLTGYPSKLQWDFPNAWPPSQMMLIEGFAANPDTRSTALQWAQKWINSVNTGFKTGKAFYEKYDAEHAGKYGGGGEYKVQEGFGWTNGGILRLLELFPADLKVPPVESSAPTSATANIVAPILMTILARCFV